MKTTITTMLALAGLGTMANAALIDWAAASTAIGSNVTNSTTTITAAGTHNYGTLTATGGQSIEFIFNASDPGTVSALGAVNDAGGGAVSFRLEQWNNTGQFGVTDQGVADSTFTGASTFDVDTHVVFTQSGGTISLFINGVASGTATGFDELTGGVGSVFQNLGGGDAITSGSMFGIASYDTALTQGEITTLNAAYVSAVPEPSSTALLGLGGIALILRRRK